MIAQLHGGCAGALVVLATMGAAIALVLQLTGITPELIAAPGGRLDVRERTYRRACAA